jgi:hypothetical protein
MVTIRRGFAGVFLLSALAFVSVPGCEVGAGKDSGASTGAPSAAGSPSGSTGTSNLPRSEGGVPPGASHQ